MNSAVPPPKKLNLTEWLILFVAILGFAFDIYELLMMPLIAGPALAELLNEPPGSPRVTEWVGYIFWGSALSGGLFGLLGGWLTDRFGRRRVLVWSILVYSFSALAAGFSTSPEMLLFFRCTTFIGVCVEFVAAVAWLAELFPNPRQREMVLGYTQAFSSIGGLLVTVANILAVKYATELPAIYGGHSSWRYTLISGLVPAIPLLIIRPFLPESPIWAEKKAAGTLKRPRFAELFEPQFRRTTIVTTILFACAYGAAFGALQLTPTRIVPGLPELRTEQSAVNEAKARLQKLQQRLKEAPPAEKPALQAELKEAQQQVRENYDTIKQAGNKVQLYQELGGLTGRVALAVLTTIVISRARLLRIFQVPGLILIPLVFLYPARENLELLKWGMFLAGVVTVAQFSYWGNYLPRAYPVYLRGTGESFAANIGGRMLGTSAAYITTNWVAPIMPGDTTFTKVAYGAAAVAFAVYLIGFITSFWLPEPKDVTD